MAIAILAAMPVEFKLIWEKMKNSQECICAGFRFWQGELEGKAIILGECGIGKVNAALATQILIERFSPTVILHSGIAGGLSSEIQHTDLVAAQDLAYYDVRKEQMEGVFPYCSRFKTNPELTQTIVKIAKENNQTIWQGTIVSGDSFINDSIKKKEIQKTWDALCVDMESAAIAHTAYINNIPFAVVRCISDLANDSGEEDYNKFEQISAEKSAALMIKVVAKVSE